jgi:uncharacterized protein YgiM (DUF1202 family)
MNKDKKRLQPKKRMAWFGILLLVAALAACSNQSPDLAATVAALEMTIAVQEDALATWEAVALEPAATATAIPSPTEMAIIKPTIMLATPPPVSTLQRPPTATPSPTVTATPTATPTATRIPDAAVGDQLTNLRSGPAVGFAILAEVDAGTPLEVLGKSVDQEWIKVRTPDGGEGWMFLLPVNLYIPLESVAVTE